MSSITVTRFRWALSSPSAATASAASIHVKAVRSPRVERHSVSGSVDGLAGAGRFVVMDRPSHFVQFGPTPRGVLVRGVQVTPI